MSNSPKEHFCTRIVKTEFIPAVPLWQYPVASIPGWRFYWNRDPGAWITAHGEKIVMTPDTAVLIPPQTPFSTGSESSFGHFYIHFSLLEEISVQRRIYCFRAADVMLHYIMENIASFSERQLYWAASAVINSALIRIPGESFFAGESVQSSVFDKAIKIIDREPGFAGSCTDLAKLCGTSVNTLQRQFLKVTGVPVKKWLLQRKMEYAVQLLLYNGYSIKETAAALNFADRYHFSKVFKGYFGISPALFVRSGGLPLP